MAFLRVNTDFDNTITEVSDTSFGDLQPNETQETTNYVFPTKQSVYFYRWNGSDIEENSNTNIDDYLLSIIPAEDRSFNITLAQYTGITAATNTPPIKNKFQAVDSAGNQPLNDITPNPIEWGGIDFIDGDAFSFTSGNSSITVLKDGLYELSFNVNGRGDGGNRSLVGVQFRRNSTVLPPTLASDYRRNGSNGDVNASLPPYLITLNSNDVLDVIAFRLGDSTEAESKAGESFVRINYLG